MMGVTLSELQGNGKGRGPFKRADERVKATERECPRMCSRKIKEKEDMSSSRQVERLSPVRPSVGP